MSNAAQILLEDVNANVDAKPASAKFLKEMGYKRSENCIVLKATRGDTNTVDSFLVCELLDVDDEKREVPFSFLLNRATEQGLILPFPYSKYKGVNKNPTS